MCGSGILGAIALRRAWVLEYDAISNTQKQNKEKKKEKELSIEEKSLRPIDQCTYG